MRRPKVQVVDDNAENCLFIVTALQRVGYETHLALNGQEGLAKAVAFEPQCLILNAQITNISVYAACRYVRQRLPEQKTRILLISSRNAALDEAYGLRHGADRYLHRPFSQQTLVQTVWEMLPEPFHSAFPPDLTSRTLEASTRLIPRRDPDNAAMRASNPFAHVSILEDERVRQLYTAIDGRKSIEELASQSGLEMREVFKI